MLRGLRWPFWKLLDFALPTASKNQRIPYHEAGHAVVAWALGETVELVYIVPFPPKTARRGDDKNAEIALAVAYGEMKAEEPLTGSSKPSAGAYGDLEKIKWILDNHTPPGTSRQEFQKRGASTAETLIARHWKLVEAVADALFNDKHLSEKRFEDIVRKYSS